MAFKIPSNPKHPMAVWHTLCIFLGKAHSDHQQQILSLNTGQALRRAAREKVKSSDYTQALKFV